MRRLENPVSVDVASEEVYWYGETERHCKRSQKRPHI